MKVAVTTPSIAPSYPKSATDTATLVAASHVRPGDGWFPFAAAAGGDHPSQEDEALRRVRPTPKQLANRPGASGLSARGLSALNRLTADLAYDLSGRQAGEAAGWEIARDAA